MRALALIAALVLSPAASARTLDDLDWLKGCWRSDGAGPEITEVWLAPPMPALLGYAYTIEDGELEGWEQTRVELSEGAPVFVAMPMGGEPVRFRSVGPGEGAAGNARSIMFENREHDYPQWILYERQGDRLTARIGRVDWANAMTFRYRRIACGGALRP